MEQCNIEFSFLSGAFHVEMLGRSPPSGENPGLVWCRYRPTEPGLYLVEVRWRGRQVGGTESPLN